MNERFITGFFNKEINLRKTLHGARELGLQIHEVYSPYPLHGIGEATGFKYSRLAWIGFVAGFIGLLLSIIFQYWTSMFDWPIIVGGKPMNSWPAFVPVAFEVSILFTGVGTMIAFIIITRLWSGKNRPIIPAGLDNQFIVVLREADASFNLETIRDLFQKNGALAVLETDDIASNFVTT